MLLAFYCTSFTIFIASSNLNFCVPVFWSLIYKIKEKPELHIETALANVGSYRDLLSITDLLNYHIVSGILKI